MVMKKGFTLAETLITLALVGIIAAFVIPAITKTTPNQNKVLFKKAYSSLERAISDLSNDEVDYPTVPGTSTDGLNTPLTTIGFNNTSIGAAAPASTDKFCYLLSQQMNTTLTQAQIATPSTYCPVAAGTGTFTTTDGIIWSMTTPTATSFALTPSSYMYIKIDVNGAKAPNCGDTGNSSGFTACTANQSADKFYIGIRYDGKMNVVDANATAILQNPTVNN